MYYNLNKISNDSFIQFNIKKIFLPYNNNNNPNEKRNAFIFLI